MIFMNCQQRLLQQLANILMSRTFKAVRAQGLEAIRQILKVKVSSRYVKEGVTDMELIWKHCC